MRKRKIQKGWDRKELKNRDRDVDKSRPRRKLENAKRSRTVSKELKTGTANQITYRNKILKAKG